MTGTKITKLLEALGDTAEAVATSLQKMRLRGEPCSATTCLIAKYLLLKNLVVSPAICVGRREILFGKSQRQKIGMSPAIFAFANGFDAGKYPQLETGR